MNERICCILIALAAAFACFSCSDERDSLTEIAFHEAGHAIYALEAGGVPSAVLVEKNGHAISCARPSDHVSTGLVCFDDVSINDSFGRWDICSLFAAGRVGATLGNFDPPTGTETDDEVIRRLSERTLKDKSEGRDWLPSWTSNLDEGDEPTAGDLEKECRVHAKIVLDEHAVELDRLATALKNDPDGRIESDELLQIVVNG